MGCDIHIYREKFVSGRWASADHWSAYDYGDEEKGMEVKYDNRAYTGRNYDFFGVLAKGVRREFDFSFEPRGLPLAVSQEVRSEHERWDADAHNASYLYLHELRELAQFAKEHTIPVSGMMGAEQFQRVQESIATGSPDWNLIYPYCAWTTDPTAVNFSFDIPSAFMFGDCLDRVINSFDGIDGENHRIVFWFDN